MSLLPYLKYIVIHTPPVFFIFLVALFIKSAKKEGAFVEVQYKIHKLCPEVTVTDLVNVSYYTLSRDFLWSGESHEPWEMVYVDKGEMVITAGTDTYLLKSGEAAFHCPHEFHNLRTSGQKSANVIVLAFRCDSPMMQAFERKILSLNAQEKACLSSIVKEAEATFRHFDNVASHDDAPCVDLCPRTHIPFGAEQIIKNLIEYFLILIYRHADGIGFDARAVPINQLHHHAQIAVKIQEYLAENYQEKITLETLAASQNISISQLKRIFKEHTGDSVITYLTALRIKEAKRMIQESSLNFSQIAVAGGYDNIYYFASVFKKHTGMTLTEYSKSLRR